MTARRVIQLDIGWAVIGLAVFWVAVIGLLIWAPWHAAQTAPLCWMPEDLDKR